MRKTTYLPSIINFPHNYFSNLFKQAKPLTAHRRELFSRHPANKRLSQSPGEGLELLTPDSGAKMLPRGSGPAGTLTDRRCQAETAKPELLLFPKGTVAPYSVPRSQFDDESLSCRSWRE